MTDLATKKAVALAIKTHRVLNDLTRFRLAWISEIPRQRLFSLENPPEDSDSGDSGNDAGVEAILAKEEIESLACSFGITPQEFLDDVARLEKRYRLQYS